MVVINPDNCPKFFPFVSSKAAKIPISEQLVVNISDLNIIPTDKITIILENSKAFSILDQSFNTFLKFILHLNRNFSF